MKTDNEVIKYVDETYPECSPESKLKICMQVFAKEYANSKIEKCANLIKENYWLSGADDQVNESILSFKDKV